MINRLRTYFCNLPQIETRRLILRSVERHDLYDLNEYLSDPQISEFTTWNYHEKMEITEEYLERVLKNYLNGNVENWGIILKYNQKLVGMVGFGDISSEHRRGEI